MQRLLFCNVRIFDGSGSAAFAGEVLVEGNRIAGVTRKAQSTPLNREGVCVVDGQGATLMPGLVEPHAHPSFPDATGRADFDRLPPEEHTLVTMHNVRTFLECGYTSIVSAASAKMRLDIAIRNEIVAGRIPGPRMRAASPELTVTGGLSDGNRLHKPFDAEPAFSMIADGADALRRIVRTLIFEGVDIIKLNISGDLGQPHAPSDHTVMTEAEVAAACEIAHARGVRLAAHARNSEAVQLCVKHGIQIIHHANYLDEAGLDALESAKDRVVVCPAASATFVGAFENTGAGASAERIAALRAEWDATVASVQAMRARGIRVLPGGDYGFAWNPHGRYARDLELFVTHFGFTPLEALAAATSESGAVMAWPQPLGCIVPGALADLLLVQGDPTHDVSVLQNRDALRLILLDGVVVKASAPFASLAAA